MVFIVIISTFAGSKPAFVLEISKFGANVGFIFELQYH
jgi:hypothetical protein